MGYTVVYQPEDNIRYPPVKREKLRAGKIVALLACILSLLVCLIWGEGILDFLLPGDADTTKAAFSNMIKQIGEGVQVGTAVDTFCREILASGAD